MWNKLFLEERPSTALSLFRIFSALATALHVFPSLLEMEDNYLKNAFVSLNGSFFPISILKAVAECPDAVVYGAAVWLILFWFLFLIGLLTQVSAIGMSLGCYFFYARNALHIGTLSYDILLVTLFLMCVTPYPGDHFSVDSWLRRRRGLQARLRPIFLQRLLQLQLAQTFMFTALSKITSGGNWLTENPYFYLVASSAGSVVKDFPLRDLLCLHPGLCYVLGITLLVFEFLLPVLWFVPRTRSAAVGAGIAFQAMLLITLHVPSLFFFLFPPQMLLFLEWGQRQKL